MLWCLNLIFIAFLFIYLAVATWKYSSLWSLCYQTLEINMISMSTTVYSQIYPLLNVIFKKRQTVLVILHVSSCLSGCFWQNMLPNVSNTKSPVLQDQDPTGCCHQHHSGANRTTSHTSGWETQSTDPLSQSWLRSGTAWVKHRLCQAKEGGVDRNAVWLICFYSFGLYWIFYKCFSACLTSLS